MLGGAFYEPVISVIPDVDTVGQTKLLADKLESLFSTRPRGFWLAERAWEPALPEVLAQTGSTYTLVDDISFESAGMPEGSLSAPYKVESRGSFVTVFPILKKLRYLIPFKPVSSTISFLRNAAKSNAQIAVYADDGEKFGAWPTTYERVYSEGWLDSFFLNLSKNADWIETVTLSDYLNESPAFKRTYLPASAYSEMMDWAIPLFAGKLEKSIALRGYWRLFFAKYPESARMYAKMLRLSNAIHSRLGSESVSALKELWKGQCNDAYWHGVFGGLYAPLLRRITYEHLIRAQVDYETASGILKNGISVTRSELSGLPEIVVDSEELGLTISPYLGGSITEINYKRKGLNLADTLTRRPERYHKDVKKADQKSIVPGKKAASIHDSLVFKEKGLESLLVYDHYPKLSFLDHLVSPKTKPESFAKQTFDELAQVADSGYESEIQKSNHSVSIILGQTVSAMGGAELRISKTIRVPDSGPRFAVEYTVNVARPTAKLSSALFIPEINLGSLADDTFSRDYSEVKTNRESKTKIEYSDLGVNVEINAPRTRFTWILPVKTVSQSEDGFESNLQGISILPVFELDPAKDLLNSNITFELD
jgi:hypothetical protein